MTKASSAAHASAEGGAPLIPLLIGVVGKRNLEGHCDAVTAAIRSKLEKVRNKYPSSPIWVLTSAAPGADWCAVVATARLAREQKAKATAPAVRLVIPLPLARTLFVQDFLPEHAARFDRLIDDRTVDLEDGPFTFEPTEIVSFALDPLDGADPTLMTRHPPVSGTSGPHRTLHYEQGALFISDNCRLLIAVMPEPADMSKVGGTARTLHYRCTGTLPRAPTQPAFDTLVAPLEKANNLSAAASFPTDDPDQHRLRRLSRELTDMREPTEWLSPRLDRVAQLVPGISPSWLYKKGKQASHGAAAEAGEEIEETTEAELLAPLKAYDFFNRAALARYKTGSPRYDDPNGIKGVLAKAAPTTPGPKQVAALVNLFAIRRMIADLQDDAKKWVNRAIWVLGALFILSVLFFTLFKVTPIFGTGLAYALLVLAAATVYAVVRLTRRSEVHDDYRAAAEALRVQVWWRVAGISERVERHYVPGAKYELDRVRAGISTINTAIALAHRTADRARGPALVDIARERWIDEQIEFFGKNHQNRRRRIAIALMALTTTFCGGSGAFLSILAHKRPEWFAWVYAAGTTPLVMLSVLAAAAFVLRFRWIFLAKASDWRSRVFCALDWLAEKSETLGRNAERLPWIGPSVGGLLKVLYPVLWCLAPMMAGWALANLGFKQWPHNFSGPLGTIVATLNGIAGAIVFWREKFAIEPEERNYAEMVEVYAAADRALDATPGSAVVLQQQILKDVGRAALAENAAWLRAHRERPIEQIAGG